MAAKKIRRTPSGRDPSKKASSSDKLPRAPSHTLFNDRAFLLVLAVGVIVRIVVFNYMGYFNNDNHLEVIEYVAEHWLPARADRFNQAYHPPLYYFLAAPLLRLGNVPAVHGLSLLLSIATLFLIARLLWRLPWINGKVQPWCLALAAFHPQFIMFSLFISNDTLAIFLGVAIFYQCRRVQATPSYFNCLLLGISLGLGLLTKAVFLVFVLPLILFICLTGRQCGLTNSQLSGRLASFVLLAGVLGCYKFVENFVVFGNSIISNLDLQNWTRDQQPTWIGFHSFIDFNLLKLVQDPIISTSTVHSYPLMIYGSFWYSLIPESIFRSNLVSPLNQLGSIIYLVALCPTLLMLVGATRIAILATCPGSRAIAAASTPDRERSIYEAILLSTLVLNLMLILTVGWRSDVWSVFQGRLLFPSYFAFLLAFSAGMEWAESSRPLTNIIRCLMIALIGLFLAYFMVEVWLVTVYPANPLRTYHMPYTIDMNAR